MLGSRLAVLGIAMAFVSACSGPAILNALIPNDGYDVVRDLAYGDDRRQRLDIYTPVDVPPNAPLVVFFYGGRWQEGSKELYPFVGQAFASRGYITAIPDYRLYPQVNHVGILEDATAAVEFSVRQFGEDVGSRPVFLIGHSAGAYIALMLVLDGHRLELPEGGPCRVADAGVGLAGPYDFLPLESPDLQAIFAPGGPSTQPIHHAGGDDPPVLLITGSDDETVRPDNTRRLAARLHEAGGRAEVRTYEGVGHVGLVAALSAPLQFTAPVLDDIDAFLTSVTSGSRGQC